MEASRHVGMKGLGQIQTGESEARDFLLGGIVAQGIRVACKNDNLAPSNIHHHSR